MYNNKGEGGAASRLLHPRPFGWTHQHFIICSILNVVHAAIIAINEAIDKEDAEETMKALRNPSAMLVNLAEDLPDNYQATLYEAKMTKAEIAKNKVLWSGLMEQRWRNFCLTHVYSSLLLMQNFSF